MMMKSGNESDENIFARERCNLRKCLWSVMLPRPTFAAAKRLFAASTILTDKETKESIGVIVNYYNASLLNEIVNGRHGEITKFLMVTKAKKTMEIFLANAEGL